MSDSYLLTDQERERFALWLERRAESSRGIIKQFETLPSAVAATMTTKEKRELAAYLIVAGILRSIEPMTIGADKE
jgi:hypothetical protein